MSPLAAIALVLWSTPPWPEKVAAAALGGGTPPPRWAGSRCCRGGRTPPTGWMLVLLKGGRAFSAVSVPHNFKKHFIVALNRRLAKGSYKKLKDIEKEAKGS